MTGEHVMHEGAVMDNIVGREVLVLDDDDIVVNGMSFSC